jgi:L-rhamnose mutarotase
VGKKFLPQVFLCGNKRHCEGNARSNPVKIVSIMKRVAFKMKLKPGCKAEYIKRHNEVWPEIVALIKNSGISDYSIFLDEATNILFGVQKVSGETSSQGLGSESIQQKWWDYMSDIMETNPDNSPISIPLEEVFYLK